ncbi:hypothetical protein ALNOE001_16320 [Candidatus Methanobinarius endosymbioticus]|uniref:Big-1 domain-containing protein n=1 Tax=Candidatus Methanobinarius endosymbioticus TaxID=2006182 RepID=A0A366M910_9EURY|nr:hypothetical protein ALNOE001_16320 [Candidatus Methanobinarius endosymbioticus]
MKTDKDKITVILIDSNGNCLANKKVTITVKGKNYKRTTDKNG